MELGKITKKRGIGLQESFGAILAVVLIAVLVIVAVFLFVSLNTTFVDLAVNSTANETFASVNSSAATISPNELLCNFGQNFAVSACYNVTGGRIINAGNYTVDPNAASIIYLDEDSDAHGFNNSDWNCDTTASWGGKTCIGTQDMITQFVAYPTLVGLVGTIVLLGIIIGVLVASFVFGGKGQRV